MKSVALTAYPRALRKRNGTKKIRAAGRVPAVIYGRQSPPQNIEVTAKAMGDLIHHAASENILVELSMDGSGSGNRLALVQEIQHHPLTGKLIHIDLHEVTENEKVTVTVPVETVGEAAGVKVGGGVIEHVLFSLKVRGLPKDLPEILEVDVSALEVGQSIHIGDIKLPAGVELLGEKKVVVISVAAPITEAQEAATTDAATGGPIEPEMIKEKKDEEGAPAEKGAAKGAAKPAADKGEKKPAEKKK